MICCSFEIKILPMSGGSSINRLAQLAEFLFNFSADRVNGINQLIGGNLIIGKSLPALLPTLPE